MQRDEDTVQGKYDRLRTMSLTDLHNTLPDTVQDFFPSISDLLGNVQYRVVIDL
jgi:hypothetical protein